MLTVYSKENCPFCVNAKNRLNMLGVEYQEKVLGQDITKEEFLNIYPNARTVPQIIEEDGTVIGGWEQLKVHPSYQLKKIDLD